MRNLIILLFLFVMISCKSQSSIYTLGESPTNLPNNAYIKDTNNILNKFSGTWKYENNGKTFTITLQKYKADLNGYYKDMLKGYYIYTNGSLTIVDTSNYPINKSKISGAWLWENNLDKVSSLFYDPERPRVSCEVDLTYSNQGGVEKLHWELKVKGIVPAQGIPGMSLNPATDVRVPTDIELIKQ